MVIPFLARLPNKTFISDRTTGSIPDRGSSNTSNDGSNARFSVAEHAPRVRITKPLDGSSILSGVPINLSGSAWDAEDGHLGGASLVWTHVGHGQFGTGEGGFINGLQAGDHTITLTATDSDHQFARATVHLRVRDETFIYLPMLSAGG